MKCSLALLPEKLRPSNQSLHWNDVRYLVKMRGWKTGKSVTRETTFDYGVLYISSICDDAQILSILCYLVQLKTMKTHKHHIHYQCSATSKPEKAVFSFLCIHLQFIKLFSYGIIGATLTSFLIMQLLFIAIILASQKIF